MHCTYRAQPLHSHYRPHPPPGTTRILDRSRVRGHSAKRAIRPGLLDSSLRSGHHHGVAYAPAAQAVRRVAGMALWSGLRTKDAEDHARYDNSLYIGKFQSVLRCTVKYCMPSESALPPDSSQPKHFWQFAQPPPDVSATCNLSPKNFDCRSVSHATRNSTGTYSKLFQPYRTPHDKCVSVRAFANCTCSKRTPTNLTDSKRTPTNLTDNRHHRPACRDCCDVCSGADEPSERNSAWWAFDRRAFLWLQCRYAQRVLAGDATTMMPTHAANETTLAAGPLSVLFIDRTPGPSHKRAFSNGTALIDLIRREPSLAGRTIGSTTAAAEAASAPPIVTAVNFEDRSPEAQCRLFASHSIIIAMHGSALGNLVCALPGSVVVEVFPSQFHMDLFALMAAAADVYSLHVVDGQGETPMSAGHPALPRKDAVMSPRDVKFFSPDHGSFTTALREGARLARKVGGLELIPTLSSVEPVDTIY